MFGGCPLQFFLNKNDAIDLRNYLIRQQIMFKKVCFTCSDEHSLTSYAPDQTTNITGT